MPPSDDLRAELQRRKTNAGAVLALFKSRPTQWIDWAELADAGGACAWRTRVADARKIVRREGGDIEWNRERASAYRYLPKRAADVVQEPQIAPTSWPVFDAPSQEPWSLKPPEAR